MQCYAIWLGCWVERIAAPGPRAWRSQHENPVERRAGRNAHRHVIEAPPVASRLWADAETPDAVGWRQAPPPFAPSVSRRSTAHHRQHAAVVVVNSCVPNEAGREQQKLFVLLCWLSAPISLPLHQPPTDPLANRHVRCCMPARLHCGAPAINSDGGQCAWEKPFAVASNRAQWLLRCPPHLSLDATGASEGDGLQETRQGKAFEAKIPWHSASLRSASCSLL